MDLILSWTSQANQKMTGAAGCYQPQLLVMMVIVMMLAASLLSAGGIL